MPSGHRHKIVEFDTGRLLATPGVLECVDREDLLMGYLRHISCDWGDVPPEDRRANNRALVEGGRLLSAYHDQRGRKFWIITEADRSATTILLPDEY